MERLCLRPYRPSDCPALARLFYETVHTVNRRDYTPRQLDAWAPEEMDLAGWDRSFRGHFALVAELEGRLAGFGDICRTGYLDRLYVGKDCQGQGVASALCQALEGAFSVPRITTCASITARGFFEKRGYRALLEQQVERRGILLTNYQMELIL